MSFSLRTISLYLYSLISGFSLNSHCTLFIQNITLIRCYFSCGLSHLFPPLDDKPQKERNTVLFTIMSPGPNTIPNMDCCCFTITKSYPTLCGPVIFVRPALQALLSSTISRSLLRFISFSQWCHLTILSSAVPFSFCPQSFPASGSFLMSQLFTSGGQIIRASTSVLLSNIHGWLL